MPKFQSVMRRRLHSDLETATSASRSSKAGLTLVLLPRFFDGHNTINGHFM